MKLTPPQPDQIDKLPISLRAYVDSKPPGRERAPSKPSDWTLIFDTETTTDPGQALRFGVYQVRHHGSLSEAGIFYCGRTLRGTDLDLIKQFAADRGLLCMPLEQFIKTVFYPFGYDLRATVIAYNLPFDL